MGLGLFPTFGRRGAASARSAASVRPQRVRVVRPQRLERFLDIGLGSLRAARWG
jgi:hypothetical protein